MSREFVEAVTLRDSGFGAGAVAAVGGGTPLIGAAALASPTAVGDASGPSESVRAAVTRAMRAIKSGCCASRA